MGLILAVNDAAASLVLRTIQESRTFSIVGLVTTETVAVQIPRVAAPADTTDAHWTALMQDGLAVTLSATDNAIEVLPNLLIRLVKAAGVASNAYGVERL